MTFTVLPSSTWDLRLEQNMNPKSFKRVQTSGRRRWRHSGWLKDFQCEAHYQCMFLFLITECLKRSEVSLLHLCFVFKDVGKMVCIFISTFCAFCFCGSKVVLCKNNISLPISVFLKHRFEDRRKCHCRTPYVCVGWRFILKLLSECETIFVFVQSLWLSDWRLLSRTNLKFDCNMSGSC